MLIACIHVPAEVLVRHSNTITSLLKSGPYGRCRKSLSAKGLLHTVDEGVECLPIELDYLLLLQFQVLRTVLKANALFTGT